MDYEARFERIEGALETAIHGLNQLTTSQLRVVESQQQMTDFQTSLAKSQQRVVESQQQLMESMVESQRRSVQAEERLSNEMRLLAEAQRHTDERLNGLIGYIEGMDRRPPQ